MSIFEYPREEEDASNREKYSRDDGECYAWDVVWAGGVSQEVLSEGLDHTRKTLSTTVNGLFESTHPAYVLLVFPPIT